MKENNQIKISQGSIVQSSNAPVTQAGYVKLVDQAGVPVGIPVQPTTQQVFVIAPNVRERNTRFFWAGKSERWLL